MHYYCTRAATAIIVTATIITLECQIEVVIATSHGQLVGYFDVVVNLPHYWLKRARCCNAVTVVASLDTSERPFDLPEFHQS